MVQPAGLKAIRDQAQTDAVRAQAVIKAILHVVRTAVTGEPAQALWNVAYGLYPHEPLANPA
jgi:hypothetical protein